LPSQQVQQHALPPVHQATHQALRVHLELVDRSQKRLRKVRKDFQRFDRSSVDCGKSEKTPRQFRRR
jgi:hypothetical protein